MQLQLMNGLQNMKKVKEAELLENGINRDIFRVEDVHVHLQSGSIFVLKDVKHVPNLTKNFCCGRQLDDA